MPAVPQKRMQNRTLDQIMEFPRIMEAVVEVIPSTPQERVQNRTPEQIVDVLVPRTMEERVPSRTQEQIMDLPVPQIMASKAYTGEVFTVEMPHQHVHQAYPGDYVVFNIKGLDKLNLLRSGDVMVPALHMDVPVPQIIEAALEVDAPQESVQNHPLEQIVGELVPPVMEAAVEVVRATPQECVVNCTPEQLVDEPVPQIAEQLVEGPVPLERIPVPSQRELHEALR